MTPDYGPSWYPVIAPDFDKDPDDTTDFSFDWSSDLGDDTLTTSTFLLPDGLMQTSTLLESQRTAIYVSGGTCGCIYRITNRVATVQGRRWDKTIYIKVRER